MPKTYRSNWNVKQLSINFNQKQWRQDFGAYVRSKLYWFGDVRVSRARIEKGPSTYSKVKGVKYFEVYNNVGGTVIVHFQNENEIVDTTHQDLVKNYFEERGLK